MNAEFMPILLRSLSNNSVFLKERNLPSKNFEVPLCFSCLMLAKFLLYWSRLKSVNDAICTSKNIPLDGSEFSLSISFSVFSL
jgi:hypothetical protein